MRFIYSLFSIFAIVQSNKTCVNYEDKPNMCINFSIGSGTGCDWMCNYCATQLGTNNYYFTDGVCSYKEGEGCVGNPFSGKTYTCCIVG
jgi:hypothetical protein